MPGVCGIRHRVMYLDDHTKGLQFADDIDHARVTRIRHVLLESQAQYCDDTTSALPPQQSANTFASNTLTHAIVDPAAGQNHFRMIACLFGPKRQIVGVDADAVATDEARLKWQEIPFCPRGCQHSARI